MISSKLLCILQFHFYCNVYTNYAYIPIDVSKFVHDTWYLKLFFIVRSYTFHYRKSYTIQMEIRD